MSVELRPGEPGDADTSGLRVSPAIPVLLVDDNPAKRLALVSVLSPLGYSIVEADSGVAALRCVEAQDFAVILLDVRMPIMDGIETAALIRRRRQSEMTPIIFLTAHAGDETSDVDPYAAGAVDFIFAPVVPEQLRAKVSVFGSLYRNAASLAHQAREVQASADQLRLLTDAAPVGIFQTDGDNRYVYTNPRWTEITGISADVAAGRKWDAIIGSEGPVDVASGPADGLREGEELCRRFEIRVPGSAPRIVLVTSKSIPDIDGGTAGWVGTLADVTAEVGAETAMSDARDKATEASRLKSDFLANMSHEIRTPMNGVIGMTDLLLETELNTRQRDYAQTVRNSGEALLAIINDILDFSKVEAGKLEIENIEFDPRAAIDDVVGLLAGPAQAKELELIAVIDKAVPALISGDPGRVRQVLTNLIANAIKFTETGEIVVRVTETERTAGAGVPGVDSIVRFEIADTGMGIEPDKLETIFQPFVQADTSTSRRYGGTGLGLAISGQLVTLMGGDCGVSSRLGEGSTFWFTIRAHTDAGPALRTVEPADSSLAGVAALIVDDSAAQRSVLSDYLTDWGMTVSTAADSETALATLRAAEAGGSPFGVVLLDQFMSGMDGLALKNAIVADRGMSAGLVLMTGLGHERDSDDVARLTKCSSLSKPIRREDLLSSLRIVLGLELEQVVAAKVSPPRPLPVGQSTLGRLLLAEDNLINQKVAVAILTTAGYSVDTVLNGTEAVRAVAAQRYDAILMDCQMPELSGYEATAAIRGQGGERGRTPIIAMTAGARREDQERCLAGGMDSYLSKPVSKDALLALVDRSVRTERP
ncbi:MAG TPA: response regulator [Acidimicrobiales bacterium]|nr:response regulator [Acidimicrobiales bacterium]